MYIFYEFWNAKAYENFVRDRKKAMVVNLDKRKDSSLCKTTETNCLIDIKKKKKQTNKSDIFR